MTQDNAVHKSSYPALLVSISKLPSVAQLHRATQGTELSALAVQILYLHITSSPTVPLSCSPHQKLGTTTPIVWVLKRLWRRRLISVWLKLAELPYQVSSWRKKKGHCKQISQMTAISHDDHGRQLHKSPILLCQELFKGHLETASLFSSQSRRQTVLFESTRHKHKVDF